MAITLIMHWMIMKLIIHSCKSTTCKAFLIFCRTIVELLQFLWKIPCHPKAAEDF